MAGGRGKARAIAAVLESRVITGLITDETTAREVVELAAGGIAAAAPKKASQRKPTQRSANHA